MPLRIVMLIGEDVLKKPHSEVPRGGLINQKFMLTVMR